MAVTGFAPPLQTAAQTSALQMGFFDNLFGGGKKATASHILIKGPTASQQCEQLKVQINKKGGKGDKLMQAFADSAASNSACPSAKKGGSLGSFSPGQMVAAFDKVVFAEDVGVVHGPIATQFGSHLILITDREE